MLDPEIKTMAPTPSHLYAPAIVIRFLIFASFLFHFAEAYASNVMMVEGQRLGASETISSSGQVFELGFFAPHNSGDLYLGIWYRNIEPKTIVWVGNRDQPLKSSSPYLTLKEGKLVIIDDRITYRVSDESSAPNTSLTLWDSGNLVLNDARNSSMIWQSFDYPTDTLLPGMKLGTDKRTGKVWLLTAWEKVDDPAPGTVSFQLNTQGLNELIILKGNQTYWSTGSYSGMTYSFVPRTTSDYIYDFRFFSNENESYYNYSVYGHYAPILSRCVINGTSGQLTQQIWFESNKQWNIIMAVPVDNCDVFSYCGPFSSCRNYTKLECQCLEGYGPSDSTSAGCARKVPLQCEESSSTEGEKDGFFLMSNVNFPLNRKVTSTISREECESTCLRNCSCNAYAYKGSGGCFLWDEDLLNLRQLPSGAPEGEQMYLKLAAYEFRKNHGAQRSVGIIIAAVVVPSVFVSVAFCSICYFIIKQKRMRLTDTAEDILLLNVEMMGIAAHLADDSTEQTGNGVNSNDSSLPQFSFKSVSASTDNFSLKNKLGEGGFGPVYKGKLHNGQEVAVKRLSRKSGQGLQELKNETTFMAKLQHKNLVRILGCCLEKGEKILIYELMPNRSLDLFLFDPSKRGQLDWTSRVCVIEGIAQGLLYLHEHSRLRIIHRDLKASNILLDKDMMPKISDFGLAKMFGGNDSQANTDHIVGTYGYMSPEYALGGLFSIRSDVFSFGVLLLEIISGKKNTGFYHDDWLNLLDFAWELWSRGVALELVDPALEGCWPEDAMLRYINVAFLCVDEVAANRPAMSEVLLMLINQNVALPSPRQPAFSSFRPVRNKAPVTLEAQPEFCLRNDVTVSVLEAR